MIALFSILSFLLGSILATCIFFTVKNKDNLDDRKIINTKENYVENALSFHDYFYTWNDRWIISSIQRTIEDDTIQFLILIGKSGLGKSHLLHAIQKIFVDDKKNKNICYITAESFVNEFCFSLREKNLDNFRKKYRKLDALLIDDFNYFCGKESIQEELFYTFAALQERRAYIGIAINSPCNITNTFTDRLSSFLSNGVKIELPKPSLGAKRAKVLSICNQDHSIMPDNIINQIINYDYEYGMRELTGKLNTLIGYKKLLGNSEVSEQDIKKIFEGV